MRARLRLQQSICVCLCSIWFCCVTSWEQCVVSPSQLACVTTNCCKLCARCLFSVVTRVTAVSRANVGTHHLPKGLSWEAVVKQNSWLCFGEDKTDQTCCSCCSFSKDGLVHSYRFINLRPSLQMFYWGGVWFQSWNENVCFAAGFSHVGQKSSFMLQMMGRWWRRCLSLKTTGSQRRSYWRSWQSSRWDVITGLWVMESTKVVLMFPTCYIHRAVCD